MRQISRAVSVSLALWVVLLVPVIAAEGRAEGVGPPGNATLLSGIEKRANRDRVPGIPDPVPASNRGQDARDTTPHGVTPNAHAGGPLPADYAIGADLSFLKQAEDRGTVFKDSGQAKPGLQIFRDHGYNWIRLRLFHTPTRLPNNLDYTIALAKDAKKLGYKFLLDYHYSDTWADPGKQTIPKAWEGKSHAELVQAVFEYTRDTIVAFRAAGVLPDMVQPGNEITPGMLWPDGKLPANWDNFAELLKAGIEGVEAGCGDGPHAPDHDPHRQRRQQERDQVVLRQAELLRRPLRRDRPILLPVVARLAAGPAREPGLHGRGVPQGHHRGGGGLQLAAHGVQEQGGAVPRDAGRAEAVPGSRSIASSSKRRTVWAKASSGGSPPSRAACGPGASSTTTATPCP